jgi:hypothetical protein
MLAVESTYVAREREDYSLLSTDDLHERLSIVTNLYRTANATLEAAVQAVAEREQLSLRAMITRDLYLILELYCTHLGIPPNQEVLRFPVAMAPDGKQRRRVVHDTPPPPLPFSEWLFDGEDEESDDDVP